MHTLFIKIGIQNINKNKNCMPNYYYHKPKKNKTRNLSKLSVNI